MLEAAPGRDYVQQEGSSPKCNQSNYNFVSSFIWIEAEKERMSYMKTICFVLLLTAVMLEAAPGQDYVQQEGEEKVSVLLLLDIEAAKTAESSPK
ncbi:hypothetical protein OS493_007235 [Desmophyllum pertusum]|uniref:Uncharacterized protein n=1 Tax=Desmophyllum pertusum TaxID=174260 RepID=A0A9W9ZIZ7_9CNID|nr:hypothetical protein OS493_007235 [Desmophyllum pertusum]